MMRLFAGHKRVPSNPLFESMATSLMERVVHFDKTVGMDIGVTLSNATDGRGVVVVGLAHEGLAARALEVGDRILRVGEHEVDTHEAAISLIDRATKDVTLVVA